MSAREGMLEAIKTMTAAELARFEYYYRLWRDGVMSFEAVLELIEKDNVKEATA